MKSKRKIIQTLCIVYKYPEILLGMKKRGFGSGLWNGFGGKVHPVKSAKGGPASRKFNRVKKESIEEAAKRELREECGLTAVEMEKVGVIKFEFQGKKDAPEVHFFWVKKWTGNPAESEEMRPSWFQINNIPLDKMWPDDKYWIPIFLDNKKFKGKFLFGKKGEIINHELKQSEVL